MTTDAPFGESTGAGFGAASGGRIEAGTRLECKVCWYVYEPARGDAHWQVPAGTAFAELPAHWSCPNCSATKDQFLVLPDA
jgi:rubredoxin